MSAEEISTRLVETLALDNRVFPNLSPELQERLKSSVALCLRSGLDFDLDSIELIAAGDQDEAYKKFSGFEGYRILDDTLTEIFNSL